MSWRVRRPSVAITNTVAEIPITSITQVRGWVRLSAPAQARLADGGEHNYAGGFSDN